MNMSVKGTTQELFVGKKKSVIVSVIGKNKIVEYVDLKRIDFMYSTGFEIGFLCFINNENRKTRFEFGMKSNNKIAKTIELIEKNNPEINIIEHNAEDLKFYQSWWFTLLMMFCCCYPIGIFLMWYNKKFASWVRTIITIAFTILVIIWAYKYYITMNNISNAMKSLQDSFNVIN